MLGKFSERLTQASLASTLALSACTPEEPMTPDEQYAAQALSEDFRKAKKQLLDAGQNPKIADTLLKIQACRRAEERRREVQLALLYSGPIRDSVDLTETNIYFCESIAGGFNFLTAIDDDGRLVFSHSLL